MWASEIYRGCHGYPACYAAITDCPVCLGISVQIALESLSRFAWNRCPVWRGIRSKEYFESFLCTAFGLNTCLRGGVFEDAAVFAGQGLGHGVSFGQRRLVEMDGHAYLPSRHSSRREPLSRVSARLRVWLATVFFDVASASSAMFSGCGLAQRLFPNASMAKAK